MPKAPEGLIRILAEAELGMLFWCLPPQCHWVAEITLKLGLHSLCHRNWYVQVTEQMPHLSDRVTRQMG